jgi:diguanylate cyclase
VQEIRFEDEEPGERSREEGLRFGQRMYLPRIFGLALGAILIGGSLWEQGASPLAWGLMLANTLVWPHVALALVRASRNPHRQELRNLMVDSASGGVWMAAMHFSPAPSVILFTMLAMDKAAVGGLRLMARCIAAQAFAAALVTLLIGYEPPPAEASYWARVACMPLLILYSITVAHTAYQLSRRVRQQAKALAALSSTDELSHLLNQAHWKRAVLGEFHRCRRLSQKATLMMLDIDRFKDVNDRYGHPAGDAVIRSVAAIVRDNVRAHDVPGRYGGDEFGVLLPGADERATHAIAERIRARIGEAVLEPKQSIRCTVSIGIAAWDPADANPDLWIARADQTLYRAKEAGRDRSEIAAGRAISA